MKVNIYDMLNFEELSLSEKVCYSTLRIEATIPPSYLSTGVGFFSISRLMNNVLSRA